MSDKIISIDTLRYYNDKISNYVDEKVSDTIGDLELDELNAILVDTDAEADDPNIPDYVTETELNTALSNKMDKVTLAAVATSGNYNDLSNKPTIPSFNFKTINGESILGSGDITISGGGNSIDIISFTQPETILSNIESGKVYVGRVGLSKLTIESFADNGSKHQEYTIVFYGGTFSGLSLILPEDVLWVNGEIPEIQPEVYYELSITRTLHGMTEKAYYKAVLTPFKSVE